MSETIELRWDGPGDVYVPALGDRLAAGATVALPRHQAESLLRQGGGWKRTTPPAPPRGGRGARSDVEER